MSNELTTSRVPMGQKIAFGIGMFANQMFPAILGIFMVVLVEFRIFWWMWSLIFSSRFLMPLPIYHGLYFEIPTKWGRRRQYVLAGGLSWELPTFLCGNCLKKPSIQFWYFHGHWSFISD